MDLLPRAIPAVAMIAGLCVGGVAAAKDAPPLEGRWSAKNRQLVLDIVRCGTAWCGIEITDGKSCGSTVLRFALSRSGTERETLRGRIELAAEARPYTIEVTFFEPAGGGPTQLLINGNAGDTFEAWRRNFPFRELLISAGPATCRADPKLS